MKSVFVWLPFLLAAAAFSAEAPRIESFTATPKVIHAGDSVTLAWVARGVPSVGIAWAPERRPRDSMQRRKDLPPSGTMVVKPEVDTVYVLECESEEGVVCMSASATVRVK